MTIARNVMIALAITTMFAKAAYAQAPATELLNYEQTYKDESAIYLQKKKHTTIDIVDGKLKITSRYINERMYLDDRAGAFSEDEITHSSFLDINEIKAYSQVPGKNKYKTHKVTEYNSKDVVEADIFHDDVKEISFVYPQLRKGAKSMLEYTEVMTEPRFFGGFFFGSYVPVKEAEFTVDAPVEVELAFDQFGLDMEKLEMKVTESKGRKTYSFRMSEVEQLEMEGGAPNLRYFAPHVVGRVKSYQVDGVVHRLLGDVSDLHGWYYSLIKNVNTTRDPHLESIVDSLTTGLTDEVEKVKVIYYWVQDNIKYIAIENGMEGFIPRNATTVYANRYGDCKDMSSIITDMLDIAGIESHITWIGTRSIPYSYHQVPTPAADNHMIATYIKDDKFYFLDATDDNVAFGYPTHAIQGKEAMINMGEEFKIVKVPTVDYSRNTMSDSVSITLEGKIIHGHGAARFSGYRKNWMNSRLEGLNKEEKLKVMIGFFGKGSNKFLISEFEERNAEEREKDLEIDYVFNIRDYHSINGDEIYLNMILEKPWKDDIIEDDRKRPIERRYKNKDNYVFTLQIPEGYKVTHVPEGANFKHDKFGYNIEYKLSDTRVDCAVTTYMDHLILETDHFEDWNKMIKQLSKNYKQAIILKKK